jgi:hypothetical protein
LTESVGDGGISFRVVEHVADEGCAGTGPFHAAEDLNIFIGEATVDILPVGDATLVEIFQLLAGDRFESGFGDLLRDDERLAVDGDDVIREFLVGVSVRQFGLDVTRRVADIEFAVADLLDAGPRVREGDREIERRIAALARFESVQSGEVIGEVLLRLDAVLAVRPVLGVGCRTVPVPVLRTVL